MIETQPILKAKIVSCGDRRVDEQLSGMPEDLEDYMQKCPFCAYPKKKPDDPRILKVFKDHSYVLMSLSNQMLVISKQHYSHWFAVPLEEQIKLFHNILDIRKSHVSQLKKPIEFHCGSAASQTVFHFHGRTGVYAH